MNSNNRVPKVVSTEVLDSLLNGITDVRDRAIIALLADTGLRAGEIVVLNLDMISLNPEGNAGSGELPSKRTGSGRNFYFGQRAAEALGAYLSGMRTQDGSDPLFPNSKGKHLTTPQLSKMIGQWCEMLGIERISVHQIRCNFAQSFAKYGMCPAVLCSSMGSWDVTATISFYSLKPEHLS